MAIYREKDAQGVAATHGGRATFKPMHDDETVVLGTAGVMRQQDLMSDVSPAVADWRSGDPKVLDAYANVCTEVERNRVILNPKASTVTINRIAARTQSKPQQLMLLSRADLDTHWVNDYARSSDVAVRAAARDRKEYRPRTAGERINHAFDQLIRGGAQYRVAA